MHVHATQEGDEGFGRRYRSGVRNRAGKLYFDARADRARSANGCAERVYCGSMPADLTTLS